MRKFFGESNQVRKITFETVAVLRPNASATSTIRTLSCSMLIPSFPNLVITWYNRNIIFSKVKRVTRDKICSYFCDILLQLTCHIMKALYCNGFVVCINPDIMQQPAAPASMTRGSLCRFIPPIAYTGSGHF